jgi:hypothetical protein
MTRLSQHARPSLIIAGMAIAGGMHAGFRTGRRGSRGRCFSAHTIPRDARCTSRGRPGRLISGRSYRRSARARWSVSLVEVSKPEREETPRGALLVDERSALRRSRAVQSGDSLRLARHRLAESADAIPARRKINPWHERWPADLLFADADSIAARPATHHKRQREREALK